MSHLSNNDIEVSIIKNGNNEFLVHIIFLLFPFLCLQIAENIQTSIVNHHNGKTDTVNGHLRQRSDSNKTERDSNKANGHLDRRKEGAGQAAKQPHIKVSWDS